MALTIEINNMKFSKLNLLALFVSAIFVMGLTSCGDDEETLRSTTFNYAFNTGQVAAAFAYTGTHPNDLTGNIKLDELEDGGTRITISINNTIDGETYATHAHDMADPATTPNATPYNETPNSNVFAMPIEGNGGTASGTNDSSLSYDELTTNYDAFFVVHDPLQDITTVDPTTYVLLGVFAR